MQSQKTSISFNKEHNIYKGNASQMNINVESLKDQFLKIIFDNM